MVGEMVGEMVGSAPPPISNGWMGCGWFDDVLAPVSGPIRIECGVSVRVAVIWHCLMDTI